MAIFEYKNMKFNYLVEGSGKPILLLNGIMMTIKSWEPVAEPLRQSNTLIRLDMMDQGQSEKQTKNYTIDEQADLVAAFVKYLGYDKVNAVGISYGGYVGLNLAIRHPEIIDRLMIFNSSPDCDERDTEFFNQFMHTADLGDPYAFYLATVPLFYSTTFYLNNQEWMKKRESLLINFFKDKEYLQSIKRLSYSCLSHDVRDRLHTIKAPTIVINGEEDIIMPFFKQRYIFEHIPNSTYISMGKIGHVTPYENPILFTSLVYGYINNPTFEFNI